MAGTETTIARNKYEDYKCSANEVISLKLVREESDFFDESKVFCPDMTHQVFGDSESIFGYKDLKVQMNYTASSLNIYLNLKYADKISAAQCDGVEADDVISTLINKMELPQNCVTTSQDKFLASLPGDANFKPFGEKVHSYKVEKAGTERQFEIYKTDIEAPRFREYHERLQTFLLFYVDAASYIDVDDEKWTYYLVFEKYMNSGSPVYAVVGYMTVYNYYGYPAKTRPRISQVLVLPPFQRMGHCATLINTFYKDITHRSDILDITVEDPSENFQRVRDYVDACNCQKLISFQKDKLMEGFSEDMVNEAKMKLKINRKQARRVYEILRLKATDTSDKEQYKAYRLDVKRRLNMPFQKNGRDFEKLRRSLNPTELAATMNNWTAEQRLLYLQKAFEETVEEYRRITDRMSMS